MTKPKTQARSKPRDLALLQGPTEDGQGQRVLRLREGQLSAGELRPAKAGQAVNSLGNQELVRLRPLEGHPELCEVEVLHERPTAAPQQSSGPARVSNERYRKNWNTIFNAKHKARRPGDWSVN